MSNKNPSSLIDKIIFFTIVVVTTCICACDVNQSDKLKPLTEAQIVDGLVNLYSIDAKMAEAETIYSDSLRASYIKAYFEGKGYGKSFFDESLIDLKNYPDSLNILQSRALDTIRVLIERSYKLSAKSEDQVN